MSNENGIQIIGDKVYYRMEPVATINELNRNKAVDEFKMLLINSNKSKFENEGYNHD